MYCKREHLFCFTFSSHLFFLFALILHLSASAAWKMQNMLASRRTLNTAGFRQWSKQITQQSTRQLTPTPFCHSRLFGSKAGMPGNNNPLGTIAIYNDQGTIKNINEDALSDTIRRISKIIGYETYDVTLLLVEDDEMRATNLETREIDEPTDILSFPFHFHIKPGTLEEPEFDIADYYTLGDLMVDVPYVIRRCQEDQEDHEDEKANDDEDDEEEEAERGVSGAMATVYDPQKRINMLLIHGMLHLVGYDHEDEEDYEQMVAREEEILEELGFVKAE
jgi:rRNA maturation RNase YbeY